VVSARVTAGDAVRGRAHAYSQSSAKRSGCTPTGADLQARLDAARMRLHKIVILRMKTWLPEETLKGLRQVEVYRREQVRMLFRLLEHARPGALAVLSSKDGSDSRK
jgi:hypothetical protein